jgi:hypothetical protein
MALDQSQYLHGMAEDENGRPIPKVKVSGMDSNSLQPVDIQSRLASTIQTHTGVVVAPSGNNIATSFIDCDGFDKAACTMTNGVAGSTSAIVIWSNDAASTHGYETIIPAASGTNYQGILDIKARYLKLQLLNNDASNPHTLNAWIMLKA